MRSPSALLMGLAQRYLPTYFADSREADVPVIMDRYGQLRMAEVSSSDNGLAEEGSYFTITTQTVGTGLTWVAAQTAFSDTTPNFYIYNGEPAGGKVIRLRSLKMIATAIATAAVSLRYAFILDTTARTITTDHTSSTANGGGPSTHQLQANPLNGAPAMPKNLFAAFQDSATASVIAASSAFKIIAANGAIGGITSAGDELSILFGSHDGGSYVTSGATAETIPGRRVSCDDPVLIPPGYSLTGHIWLPSSSASFNPEVKLGLSAR